MVEIHSQVTNHTQWNMQPPITNREMEVKGLKGSRIQTRNWNKI